MESLKICGYIQVLHYDYIAMIGMFLQLGGKRLEKVNANIVECEKGFYEGDGAFIRPCRREI